MAEHGGTGLESGSLLDLTLESLPDAAQASVAELVLLPGGELHGALLGKRALRHHHDRERPAASVPAPHQAADFLDVEGPLRDQDHVGAAGDAGMQGDPAGVTAHHLDDHHPVVRLRGGVEAVDGLGRDLEPGVESERDVRRGQVVVDRLRDAYNLEVLASGCRDVLRGVG